MADSLSSSVLLDPERLRQCLGPAACRFELHALACVDSTNTLALQKAAEGAASGTVWVADQQTAGRGRRGREWLSPRSGSELTDSLTFSVLWRFPRGLDLSGLSLAVGVGLLRGLKKLGLSGAALKWPNDLLVSAADGSGWRKAGGVLIELSGARSSQDGVAAVVGIGINLRLPGHQLDQPVAGLDALLAKSGLSALPERHLLLAELLRAQLAVTDSFLAAGFGAIRVEWEAANAFADRPVRLTDAGALLGEGVCVGVADDGALRVRTTKGEMTWRVGDVSLRSAGGS